MFFSLIFRVISAVCAFLYPGYASYKTLSQRPASEAELEKWLMYWSVLGCIVAFEYVAEWFISWVPFYYPLKTAFLLYLALPQTSGASYLYSAHVQPFFAAHESEIDSALSQFKTYIYNYLQRLLRTAWQHLTLGQASSGTPQPNALDEGGITGEAALNSGAPPSLTDPVSGPAQLAQTLWSSYGPSILTAGMGFLRQAEATSQTTAAQALNTPPIAHSRTTSSQSVNDRRRQLEAELASLNEDSLKPYDVSESPVLVPSANNPSRPPPLSLHQRNTSGGGRSTFEEVDVLSDMED
ncbi:TB2/DP1, HVA22 family-domain-containing protein [Irpex rosettiformis]|uniref:TB2/DP1, HVA22 family-domain-containing protein n=1 Tax=Irpex rosettiformis TaxID=378272 RepID=A0ACB8U2B4_9APHY|nr:TB2/DP1, HVA22 family-domain-containing protein [Irpex rosettiformis]